MSGTPRVLQVVLSLNAGGTERLVVELASRLHPQMPMAVCCLDEAGDWASELRAHRIEVSALGRTPGFHPSLGRRIAAAAIRHDASLIHAHHYTPFVYSCLARLSRPGLRVAFTEHGRLSDAPPSTKRRLANSVLTRFPHRVFAVSEDLKRHMVGEGFTDRAVDVIYNGIDVGPLPTADNRREAREELGVPDDQLVIGTVARLDPVKDLETLLRAAASLSRQPTVWIIGDGGERAGLESIQASLDSAADVRFLGQRRDARRLLAGCDLYVNCSISEGVSLTILEAMAAALPIVATRVGGTPEVLDESSSRLVPSRDPETLAGTLRELADQPDVRRRLGRAARQRVERHFALDRMVSEYGEVYSGLSARGSKRRSGEGD